MTTPLGYRGSTARLRDIRKGGGAMSARIQALLIVLGTIALAALNASSPWGP
jgi:hypothetical protein